MELASRCSPHIHVRPPLPLPLPFRAYAPSAHCVVLQVSAPVGRGELLWGNKLSDRVCLT